MLNLLKKQKLLDQGLLIFFFLSESSSAVINDIIDSGDRLWYVDYWRGKKCCSWNLFQQIRQDHLHVGHGRGAAYGATISNLLRTAAGFKVDNEYYVNDAGRQMDILTVSIFFRYLELYLERNLGFLIMAIKVTISKI